MVKENIGLRGYIGEKIVEIWLKKIFPKYKVIRQVIPEGVDKRGGPYLDFAVVKDKKIIKIYEVKTQEYPLNKINKALCYIWESGSKIMKFKTQDNKEYIAENFEAYIILLQKSDRNLWNKYKDKIIFFKKIFNNLDIELISKIISEKGRVDIIKEINTLSKQKDVEDEI